MSDLSRAPWADLIAELAARLADSSTVTVADAAREIRMAKVELEVKRRG